MGVSLYAGPRVPTGQLADQAKDRRRGQPPVHPRAGRRGADHGIDIDAKSEMRRLRRKFAAAGEAVVVATSEFEALVGCAYRASSSMGPDI